MEVGLCLLNAIIETFRVEHLYPCDVRDWEFPSAFTCQHAHGAARQNQHVARLASPLQDPYRKTVDAMKPLITEARMSILHLHSLQWGRTAKNVLKNIVPLTGVPMGLALRYSVPRMLKE